VNLIAQATKQNAFILQAIEKDKFAYADEEIILEFNPIDRVMILKQSGQTYNFEKE